MRLASHVGPVFRVWPNVTLAIRVKDDCSSGSYDIVAVGGTSCPERFSCVVLVSLGIVQSVVAFAVHVVACCRDCCVGWGCDSLGGGRRQSALIALEFTQTCSGFVSSHVVSPRTPSALFVDRHVGRRVRLIRSCPVGGFLP